MATHEMLRPFQTGSFNSVESPAARHDNNMTSLLRNSALRQQEISLAGDKPFGSWRSIINRMLTFYSRGSELLAKRSPAARELIRALDGVSAERRYRVLGDPVVRDIISRSLERLQDPSPVFPADLEEILATATSLAAADAAVSPLEAATPRRLRLGEFPKHCWVWCDERPDEPLGRHFRGMFDREISHSISSRPAILRTPDERMVSNLVAGFRLLHTLMPDLARSVCAHVHLVAVVDVADRRQWIRETRADLCQNVSTHAIPGTIFLSPSPLRSPWHAAEALLHEAAHKKLSDLVLTWPIFRRGYTAADSPTIRAPWNSPLSWNSNDWSIDRALFAFHVYVHLALFFLVVQRSANELVPLFGPLHGMKPSFSAQGALDRARYLGTQLRRSAGAQLGPAGERLVDWLFTIMSDLDPSPQPTDPTMHLWLDRYDRETREVGDLIARIDPKIEDEGTLEASAPYEQWSVRRIVDHLVHSDIVAAYRVLSILGETHPPKFSFYDADRWSSRAPSTAPFSELASTFQSIRTFLSRTLRALPPDAFERTCLMRRPKSLREIVEDMVEHPYRHVDALVTRVRRATARAAKHSHDPAP